MSQKYAWVYVVFMIYVEHSTFHVQIKHITQQQIITCSVFKHGVLSLDLPLGWVQNEEASFAIP